MPKQGWVGETQVHTPVPCDCQNVLPSDGQPAINNPDDSTAVKPLPRKSFTVRRLLRVQTLKQEGQRGPNFPGSISSWLAKSGHQQACHGRLGAVTSCDLLFHDRKAR